MKIGKTKTQTLKMDNTRHPAILTLQVEAPASFSLLANNRLQQLHQRSTHLCSQNNSNDLLKTVEDNGRRFHFCNCRSLMEHLYLCNRVVDRVVSERKYSGVSRYCLVPHRIPGKEGLMVTVEIAPGESVPKHRHNSDVFVYVLSGTIVTQVQGQPAKTLHAGETFVEAPADIHLGSRNPSKTEPTRLLVFFVKDKGAPPTVYLEPHSSSQ